ncbi:MAG: hypothetical protein JWL76_376 [Thermoleophilia bacterium]|nr:hypothetical protein [Thermoleophilia bacterium]
MKRTLKYIACGTSVVGLVALGVATTGWANEKSPDRPVATPATALSASDFSGLGANTTANATADEAARLRGLLPEARHGSAKLLVNANGVRVAAGVVTTDQGDQVCTTASQFGGDAVFGSCFDRLTGGRIAATFGSSKIGAVVTGIVSDDVTGVTLISKSGAENTAAVSANGFAWAGAADDPIMSARLALAGGESTTVDFA